MAAGRLLALCRTETGTGRPACRDGLQADRRRNIQPVIRQAVSCNDRCVRAAPRQRKRFSALDAGAQALKIFPVVGVWSGHISALAVLPPDVPLFAVGGVTPENWRNGLKQAVWARDWVAISIAPGNPLNAPRRLRHLLCVSRQ